MSLILLIEDQPDLSELISFNLTREGFSVHARPDALGILDAVLALSPQLIILDLMLPGLNGYDACKLIKQNARTQDIPILIISAKSEEADIVTGLELGADDYLPKPFSPRVLVARVRALLRRTQPTQSAVTPSTLPHDEDSEEVKTLHGLSIDPNAHEVRYEGQPISLTVSEFKALEFLAQKPGWVFSRYQIVEAIRGENYFVTDRTIDVLMVGLRKKLGKIGSIIETVRGVGYRLKSV
jgi:two-component system alkaline phosphatase synthesis response regulator PhoP